MTDATGVEVDVPVEPRRVVFLDMTTFGNAVALGFDKNRIAAISSFGGDVEPYRWIEARYDVDLASYEQASFVTELNVEQVATLRPDLIIMLDGFDAEASTLRESGVAVYVTTNDTSGIDGYIATLENVADALNVSERSDEVSSNITERIEILKAKLGDRRPSTTAMQYFSDPFIVSFALPIFDALGLPRQSPPVPESFEPLSEETIDVVDGDILWVNGDGSLDEVRARVESNPLWSDLDVVTNGVVRFVETSPWAQESSIPAVEAILDEVGAGIDEWLAQL